MDLPPIEHITQNYVPLRSLVLSVSERCGKELANILRTSENLPNDAARKEQFLKFVVASRQEYVKLYVLCKWAVVSQDISRAIDVTNWLHGQVNCFNNVVSALYHLQLGLGPAKSPWADIETALEVLKYGSPTPQISALHHVPPKRLNNSQVLQVLRRLDVLLAMRLALHENLPQHFREYRVFDGRAQFSIGDGALWVELSIAEEDVSMSSRFFYVDCGAKATNLHTEFKTRIEHAVNELLGTSLVAALDWLARFSATYKLQLLGHQLRQIEQTAGPFCGVVSHRVLSDKLELFVFVTTPNTAESVITVSPQAPYSLVLPVGVKDCDSLNASEILSQVTRYHAGLRMKAITAPWIRSVSDFSVSFDITSKLSTELTIDTTSGMMALHGNGPLFLETQNRLNSFSDDVVKLLNRLRAQVCVETVASRAEAAGWRAQRNVRLAPDEFAKIRGSSKAAPSTGHLLALRLRDDTSGWALCVAYGLPEPQWFVSRLECSQRRWVLGPIHLLHTLQPIGKDQQPLTLNADPDYGTLVELMSIYRRQFVLFELMRELSMHDARFDLCTGSSNDMRVVVDISTLVDSPRWAQSGVVCSVSETAVCMEGRTRPQRLQPLGMITQEFKKARINVNGTSGEFMIEAELHELGTLVETSYLQSLLSSLEFLNHAAKSLTSAISLGFEVRSATLSSLEIKYVAENGVLTVQNNSHIVFGDQNPQRALAPFLPTLDEHSKSSLVRTVTFLREWYPVWEIVMNLGPKIAVLPQSINRFRVAVLGSGPNRPYVEVSLRNFRRQNSVNFVVARNGAEKIPKIAEYFSKRVENGVVPLVSGCAIDIGCEHVIKEILEATISV